MNKENCEKSGVKRCTKCIINTASSESFWKSAYNSLSLLGNHRLINQVDAEEIEISSFHALSSHLKETYGSFGYPKEKIKVIPNVVDESFFVPHQSDFKSPYQLLYIGYLRQHKGVQMLPEVAALLKESGLQFQLTIIGDGPMMSEIKDGAERTDTSDCIDFRGHVSYEELPEIYASHDLFI
jgi:glycosyltransferase involved in cell wall biosynthesis